MSSWSLVSFAGFRACLIYMCLTEYEFSFILFIHHNIHFYFELCTYCNILDIYLLWNMNSVKYLLFYMELLNYLFCDMFGGILGCYELTHISWTSTPWQTPPGSHAWVSRHCYPIGCVIKSTHQGICSCSPIVNFLEVTFYHGMVTSVIFLIKKINLNRHIKHENLLSIYENMDNFQIMLFIVTCWKFQ